MTGNNWKVHYTECTEVVGQLVTINEKFYVGLLRNSYYDYMYKPRLKSILLPIEALTTFLTQAVPTLDTAIMEQQAKVPALAESPNSRKQPYSTASLRPILFLDYSSFNIQTHFSIIANIIFSSVQFEFS